MFMAVKVFIIRDKTEFSQNAKKNTCNSLKKDTKEN